MGTIVSVGVGVKVELGITTAVGVDVLVGGVGSSTKVTERRAGCGFCGSALPVVNQSAKLEPNTVSVVNIHTPITDKPATNKIKRFVVNLATSLKVRF